MSDITELFPIKAGDTFVIGPDHFVCIGWENGRIKAVTHDRHGFYTYSLSPDVLLSPGFRMLNTYYPKELLALAKARGVDEEQLIRDIECNAAIQNCHPSKVVQALLAVLTSSGITPDEIGELSDINLHGHESREALYKKRFFDA